MIRILPFACAVGLIGLVACNNSVLEPRSERLSAGQTRPGGTGPAAQGGERPAQGDDPPLTVAPAELRTQGVVTQVPSRLGTAAFLIEEQPDRPLSPTGSPLTDGGKYHVFVPGSTVIRRRGPDGQMGEAALADITVGTRAEVWFSGPIRESWPAQGTAGRIMIFDSIP
jgi:hypothetical protein